MEVELDQARNESLAEIQIEDLSDFINVQVTQSQEI